MISQTQSTNPMLLLAKAGVAVGSAQFSNNQKVSSVNLFAATSDEELSELLNISEIEPEVDGLLQSDVLEEQLGPKTLLTLNEVSPEGEGSDVTLKNTEVSEISIKAKSEAQTQELEPHEAELLLTTREALPDLRSNVSETLEEGSELLTSNQNPGSSGLDLATTLEQHVDTGVAATASVKEVVKPLELAARIQEAPNVETLTVVPIRAVGANGAILSLQQFEPNVVDNNIELSIDGSTLPNKNANLLSHAVEAATINEEIAEGESEVFQVAEAEESPFSMFETDAEEVILYEEVDGKTEYVKFKADLPQLEIPELAFKESESIQLASLDAKEQYTKLPNPGDLPEQIKFEVSQAIEAKNDVVKFVLNPANLGEVEIKFITDPITKELNVSILSEKYATLDILNDLSKEIEHIIQEAHNGSADISLNLGLQERSRNFHEMVASHIANQEDGEKLAQASDVYTSSISLASIITEGGLNIVV